MRPLADCTSGETGNPARADRGGRVPTMLRLTGRGAFLVANHSDGFRAAMSRPDALDRNARGPRREISAIPARWGFLQGLADGSGDRDSDLAVTVWNPRAARGGAIPMRGFMRIMRLTTVFRRESLPLLTAGGIGRLAAVRLRRQAVGAARSWSRRGRNAIASRRPRDESRRFPHGHLPVSSWAWLPMPLAGLVAGLVLRRPDSVRCAAARRPSAFAEVLVARTQAERCAPPAAQPGRHHQARPRRWRTRTTQPVRKAFFEPAPLPPKSTDARRRGHAAPRPRTPPPATPPKDE